MKKLILPLGMALCLGSIFLLLFQLSRVPSTYAEQAFGEILHETTSDFSLIRVRERAEIRSLLFVEENGAEQRQSAIDLRAPHQLEVLYTRHLFVSFLFRQPQERVLIVGLGGGGMVRFLNHAFPEMLVEAVEIDPAVVRVAAEYFGTQNGPRTQIHTEDAFDFLGRSTGPFDAIYMDAFLRPKADSGLDQVTQRLKTVTFLQQIQERLKPGGLVAFNLIETDPTTDADLSAIREAFPSVYLFTVPNTRNLVVIASLEPKRWSKAELRSRADQLEAELDVGLSFGAFVDGLRE